MIMIIVIILQNLCEFTLQSQYFIVYRSTLLSMTQIVQSKDTTARNLYKPIDQKQNPQIIEPYKKTDKQFFTSLAHFTPFPCYTGNGVPLFLFNKGWYLSLGCLLIINALFFLVVFIQVKGAGEGYNPLSQDKVRIFTTINLILIILIDISYIMTQFMNPGIRNLSTISAQEFDKNGSFFCVRCNGNRTKLMEHCIDCEVCIEDLDHHCGFFGKCIGGGLQKYAFFVFIALMGIGLISLMVTMVSVVGLT